MLTDQNYSIYDGKNEDIDEDALLDEECARVDANSIAFAEEQAYLKVQSFNNIPYALPCNQTFVTEKQRRRLQGKGVR